MICFLKTLNANYVINTHDERISFVVDTTIEEYRRTDLKETALRSNSTSSRSQRRCVQVSSGLLWIK